MTDLTRLSPAFAAGTVWLVGAGPGDPGLLSVHAINALAQADVVVHDALIGEGVLAFARDGAELEYAGKRGGRPSAQQDAICERLIALARAGKRVVRLKGGDPFVFGRGGEEALALAQAGVSFRIVPGVSSGLAALAQHGVPATTRETNHAVILATGHCAAEDESVDWEALARAGVPIVLYMAVSNLGSIAEALMRGGLAADTPTLVVHGATTARESLLEAPLAQLPELAERGAVSSPSIVAIGAIAAFRQAIAQHVQSFRVAVGG